MAKQSGLGDNFYVQGADLSGDVNAIGNIGGGPALLDFTTINKSAFVRQGGLRDGTMGFTSFFDPSGAGPFVAGPAPLQTLPRTDEIFTYFRGQAIGNPAASLNAKQLNFDPTRGNDGALTMDVQGQGNGFGLEWGNQLTPGIRTDVAATAAGPTNSFNTLASASFGGQMYIHVFSVTGTSVTLTLWDSADNVTFAAVAGFATTGAIAPGGAPTAVRIASTNVTVIRQYVAIASTGTFSNAQFAVMLHKNEIAGIVF